MPIMSSLSKPKLDRRNARKIDYEPSDSPRSSISSRFRTLDKESSKSFRVTGLDSEGQIDKICEEIGISGGADAFGISEAAWEAGKAKSGSLDRFTLGGHKVRSKSLDKPPDSFFAGRRGGEEEQLISPPLQEVRSHAVNAMSSSISSSSSDSFSSDTSNPAAQKMLFGLVDTPEDQMPPHHGGNMGLFTVQQQDDHRAGYARERFSRDSKELPCSTVLPPPPNHVRLPLHLLSTHELLASFAPDEHRNDGNNQAISSDHEDTSQSDSEGDQAAASEEEESEEELAFASKVAQQRAVSAQEHTLLTREHPVTPEHNATSINIQAWRKLDMLGSGSFGTVYEGMSEDGIYFAVKEVSLSENDSKAQQCVLQLEQEIEVLSKFQHDNIVRYLGTQKEPDKLYIFLELVTKGSLASLYQKYALFDSQIRLYTRQILSGLKYLHERKIMHRDIKCANILVHANGTVKLADFGLARQISQLDELKSCKGSAYWMAPEVIDPRKTYSFPADVWSLGCTVLEMETRRPPFGDMEWHRAFWKVGHGEGPPIPETLSEDAKDFIRRCLEINPAKRPSAGQLLEHPFVQYVGGTGLTPRNSLSQETAEL